MCVSGAKLFVFPTVDISSLTYNKSYTYNKSRANANEVIKMYPVSVGNLFLVFFVCVCEIVFNCTSVCKLTYRAANVHACTFNRANVLCICRLIHVSCKSAFRNICL